MSIDIPRIQPVVTPPGAMDEEEIRVRRTAPEPRIPAELPQPSKERRGLLPRRRFREQRPEPFESRDGHERRSKVDTDA
ncbi:MAG: hypothetical protein IPJ33_10395 [Gammaproteobacteria bacterium]|jgi:hypothetical protein|nr:hypothetical protein [Gammaproteobacteria bacterium]MBP6050588.1 hypothetical protein [Pseudomonadales bacterium]MBK6583435.1 hypothetical protein [Gammaproteobacteria bacterium]MBK7168946.1 hypothetical protein [Gammaproteobacteria bacterium]MBK7521101.1 hypothetical protein [Gammaproteobacteria bacterium]